VVSRPTLAVEAQRMVKPLSHYRRRVAEKGVRGTISSRFDFWRLKLTINNPTVGRAIELAGNRVRNGWLNVFG
jgi:hypothetical protein